MKQGSLIELGKEFTMNTYNRFSLVIERGEGNCLFDIDGKRYLDFASGIAVNALGYGNKELAHNLENQLSKVVHCSNLYWNEPAIKLAQTLVTNSCFDKTFFCNSGTEAVEAALKLAKKYGKTVKGEECFEIISMEHSFHGRTLGSISVTGQTKYQKDFTPLLEGIKHSPYNDFALLEKVITDKTCAIILEPIQGEGGIHPADADFLRKVRTLCNDKEIALVFDEVQCGIGRTGTLFAYQNYDIEPDIIALAKGLGGGLPIGAMLANKKFSNVFQPGDHAATFGGNPLSCSAANTVIDFLVNKDLLLNVKEQGKYLKNSLLELQGKFNVIKEIRGMGLMQGMELTIPAVEIVKKAMDKGLLLVGAGANVVRFVPPLTIKSEEIDTAMEILSTVLKELS